jgi:hypothetical protein
VSASAARRARRAQRGTQAVPASGIYLLVHAHDDECGAPLLNCTCTADVHYVPFFSELAYLVREGQRDRSAAIRRGLS